MQTDAQRLQRQLESDEGRRALPYRDSKGILTIGIGRNLESRGLRQKEIDFLFQNDVKDLQEGLTAALPWVSRLDPVRANALLDMAFMGVPRLLGFSKMLTALREARWEDAAREALDSKWAREDVQPSRSVRVATMFLTGQWPEEIL